MRQSLILLALLSTLASCGGGSESHSPTEPSALGRLHFVDSGCACVKPPYPGIAVYIDGQSAGVLPVFGSLTVNVPAGSHTWSTDSAAAATASVVIQPDETTTVRVFTNLGCSDGCSDT